LLRRNENLGTEQYFRLRDLLRHNPKTVRAYLSRKHFSSSGITNSPVWAGKFLDERRRQTIPFRIEPMRKIARSLRQHRS
jgi:hypothetical protein